MPFPLAPSTRRCTASSTTPRARPCCRSSRGWPVSRARARHARSAPRARSTPATALTDYPLGVVKAIPYQAHLALDALGAVALAATPFVTGQFRKGRRHWVPHVGLALFEFSSLAISDPTGYGDYHGDVHAVRRANAEDPHRKIHNGTPAVRPAAAAT